MITPIVDTSWLSEHRDEVVVADVRWYLDGRSGRGAYDAGHIPGAVFVDLDAALTSHGDPRQGRHPLPEPDTFAATMAALGIGDADTVVAYDDDGGAIAARLVWMLRVTGHEAALLSGGLPAWDGELQTAAVDRPPARFTPRPWPRGRLASIDDAAAGPGVVIDARARARYAGEADAVDPRCGHIPGAHSLPCRENLDADGCVLGPDELRRRFAAAGVSDGATVISYCGSGVTACHNLLTLEYAGLGVGRLFPGSWSQWSRDPTRPVAAGDEPGEPGV